MNDLDDQHFVSPRVVNILVIHWLPRNYGNAHKQTSPSGSGLGIGLFTAIIPCHPVNNYNLQADMELAT